MDEHIEADMKRIYTTSLGEDDWNYLINWWQDDEWLDEMTKQKIRSQTNEESVEAMFDDEIYDKGISTIVGPPRSGYIRV